VATQNDIIWDDEDGIEWEDQKPKAPAVPYGATAPETETRIVDGFDERAESPRLSQEAEDYYISALNDPNIPLGEININLRRMAAKEGTSLLGEAFDPVAAQQYRDALAEGKTARTDRD